MSNSQVNCHFFAVASTAMLIILAIIPRMVLITLQPFAVEKPSAVDPDKYLKKVVDEWNEAPITAIWVSEEACGEPAFTRTWNGTAYYEFGNCLVRHIKKHKCDKRAFQDATDPIHASSFLDKR